MKIIYKENDWRECFNRFGFERGYITEDNVHHMYYFSAQNIFNAKTSKEAKEIADKEFENHLKEVESNELESKI